MAALRDIDPIPTLQAHLGPTNTGKTHRAVQRMLARRTGMIGLPLRLLAREVYDRVVAKVGEESVALVTGEEKRVPRKPRYWVCTVESMPTSRAVDFLAVDEIQLCAHRERGHAFTSRLLHARGLRDTWFMGSDTMEPVIRDLLPTCEVLRHPRLSRLRWSGVTALADLPERSVVVCFSVAQVYEVAERLRRRRGGAAVVLGALSPRARNAQVAMYQAGEVQYMVATDAIGMGLNMDVDHVAFAATRKFDGRIVRDLGPAELAQVAGRAGRYTSDGTFGTLEDAGELDPRVVADIEGHRFDPVKHLIWRNDDLDMSTVPALMDSLRARPRSRWFTPVKQADDANSLWRLAERPEVRALAHGPEQVALLWEVCQVPDFRKLLEDSHTTMLTELYTQLAGPKRALDPGWLSRRLDRQDRVDGDIDSLTTRIAFVRTWTYITNRAGWLDEPETWQRRAKEIEDRLSDALHERLTWRFVDHRTGLGRPSRPAPPPAPRGEVLPGRASNPDSPFAALRGLDLPEDPSAAPVRVGATLAQIATAAARAEALLAADDADIQLAADLSLQFEGRTIGVLTKGPDLARPGVAVRAAPGITDAHRRRLTQALTAWARRQVEALLAPLRGKSAHDLSGAGRGLRVLLEAGLGSVSVAEAATPLRELALTDGRQLARLGIRRGTRYVYAKELLRPEAVRWRAALWAVANDCLAPPIPRPGAACVVREPEVSPDFYAAIGYPSVGTHAIRVDQLERTLARLRSIAADGPFTPPDELLSWLGVTRDALDQIAEALGGTRLKDGRFDGQAVRRPRPSPRRARTKRRSSPRHPDRRQDW
jgi:ATP-dependent RNA helicase SUPV3L1/SUV3